MGGGLMGAGALTPLPHWLPASVCTQNHVFHQLTDTTTSETHLIFLDFSPQDLKWEKIASDRASSRSCVSFQREMNLPHRLYCRDQPINTWQSNSRVLQQRKILR